MNPDKYQELASRTECDQRRSVARMANLLMSRTADYGEAQLRRIRVNHAVIGLTGEVGELSRALEKWVYYGGELDTANMVEEVGDCLWYLAELCNALGLSLGVCMEANLAKLRARYPEKFTDEAAANRDLEAERQAAQSVTVTADWLCGCGHVNLPVDRTCGKCCAYRPGDSPEEVHLTLLERQKKYQADCGHEWKEPDRDQTRCVRCGAYRHLGSGFRRCPVNTEPCCECGEEYPRRDLLEGGEVYCPRCRVAKRMRERENPELAVEKVGEPGMPPSGSVLNAFKEVPHAAWNHPSNCNCTPCRQRRLHHEHFEQESRPPDQPNPFGYDEVAE